MKDSKNLIIQWRISLKALLIYKPVFILFLKDVATSSLFEILNSDW